ncbi:uncharacterized protein B0I36DRAFT_353963 [Microdochium trichocladiopsis]|uniref:DUF2470 domain-containing protein n=1 Tax=Microdochium trichocladiopsis TaxID=1682393 RepID=A0A9P8XW80_9PEZI|nr:uncharacterized protein B0I36DRAFT_353963 [Microdochium trichocladiopsis]KAH7021289.1 hypothetical protein B0I36DRAFT_353963 [Microdochium trichocladiopsis]
MATANAAAAPGAPPSDDALKARIITHMNRDHAAELAHYLRAFNGIPASAARGAQLTDLTLDTLHIETSASGTKPAHTVAISPPMASLSESRVRLVEMAKTAQAKLGLSDIKMDNSYTRPEGGGIASFAGVAFYFLSALALPWIKPGTAAWDVVDSVYPSFAGGAGGFVWLTRAIVVPVLLIHITEAWWMARTRLAKHSVDVGSRTWWLWTGNTFFEGAPAFWRFDKLVEAERVRRQGIKH